MFNECNAYDNFELDKDIQKMESQSVKTDRYLEELEIHRTPNKVDLTPSPYPKRFSLIPNSLDVDFKDKTENIRCISTSLKTVSRNLIQDNFSENNNTSRNSNKPHSQPIDSFIDVLIEGEETVLCAVTSENIIVAAGLQQELEARHLPPIDLIPFDGNSHSILSIGTNGLYYASALKLLKRDFGHPLVVTHLKLKPVFDKPQIKSGDRIALRECDIMQCDIKCVITWLGTMDYLFSLNSIEHLTKTVKRLPNFLRHSFYKYCNPIKHSNKNIYTLK